MFKTAILTFIGGLLFLASLPLGATMAHAQTTAYVTADYWPNGSKVILNGLWDGANLRFDTTPDNDIDVATANAAANAAPATVTTTTGGQSMTDAGSGTVTASDGTVTTGVASQVATNRYVALGDSVAAGAGLPPVSGATSRDRTCKRSGEAYPYLVAQASGLELTHVACSGAKATNLLFWQGIRNQPNPSRQISYIFAGGRPELVTITVGANDMRWSEFLLKCYRVGASCGPETRSPRADPASADLDTRTTDRLLDLLSGKWAVFFTELELRSGGTPPTVIVTGYYDPFSEQCLTQAPDRVTPSELAWMDNRVDKLNRTLQDAVADRPYVRFAPVDFSGHDVCSDDSWVQGLTTANGNVPIHPTTEGQRAIAEAVLQAY